MYLEKFSYTVVFPSAIEAVTETRQQCNRRPSPHDPRSSNMLFPICGRGAEGQ
jgi:hypothetical protein